MAAAAATTQTASPTTPATNLSGTPISQLSVGAPPATPPQPNFNSVSSTNLQPSTPVQLPTPPPPNTTQANGIVAGAQQTSKSVQDYINQLTPPTPGPAAQANQSILDSIAQLTGEDTGKDQALLDAQNATGATQDQADLTALNNQLLTKTAQYNNEQANLGGNGSVETSAVLAAQNAGLTKARAADIGLTTAQIQAKQGDLTLAQNTAQQAVDAKYSTIEDNIKTAQAQLAAVQPLLTEEQKTTALAQQQQLQDQADAVAQKKADEAQIQTIGLQAAANGANQGIIAAITNATDPNVALQLATPYLAKAPTQVVEVNGHSLLIDSQTGKTVQDLGVSNSVIQANIAHAGTGGGGADATAPKLTATQIGVVNKANAAVNNSKTGIAFQNATNAYNAIQTIDPTTTNPSEQQQALLNLAQLEFPGTNSARGLLGVNPATAQNSGFANALIKAQQTLQARGSLSGGVIAQLQSQAKSIYTTIQQSYDSAFKANVASVAKTLNMTTDQAEQYLTNYNSNGQSSTTNATTASGKPFDYQSAIKAGYTDAQIQAYLKAN